MTSRERIVLVVASGLVLAVIASVLSALLWVSASSTDGGWFADARSAGTVFDRSGITPETALLAAGAIWLAAVAIWTPVAIRLSREPLDDEARRAKPPEPG